MVDQSDNVIAVVQKLISFYELPITDTGIDDYLISHPEYPTLKSVCDAFEHWGIKYHALKMGKEEIIKLEYPYIAHIINKGETLLYFVQIYKNNVATYYDSDSDQKKMSVDELVKKCSGAIVLIEPDEQSGEQGYKEKKENELIRQWLPTLGLATIIILLIPHLLTLNDITDKAFDFKWGGLIITKVIGIVFSVLLILKGLNIQNSLTDKICRLNKSTDCDSVLASDGSKIFGWINWADIGFIYFTGGLICVLSGVEALSLLAIISSMSMVYPFYSIYYQAIVVKKWCPLCLGVQTIIITEFLLLFSYIQPDLMEIVPIAQSFIITGCIYLLWKGYDKNNKTIKQEHQAYLKLKRNPHVFLPALHEGKRYDLPISGNSLIFGSKDSLVTVTAFLNLTCYPCSQAFFKLKKLIAKQKGITLHVVFSISQKGNILKCINTLFYIKEKYGNEEALNFLSVWYDQTNRDTLLKKYTLPKNYDVIKDIQKESNYLYHIGGVSGTPTIMINGYKLPGQYDIDDIPYFTDVLGESEKTNALKI